MNYKLWTRKSSTVVTYQRAVLQADSFRRDPTAPSVTGCFTLQILPQVQPFLAIFLPETALSASAGDF